MGAGSAKKTPSKKGRSPAHERRSPSKALKTEHSPASLFGGGGGSPEKKETPRETGYTHLLPTEEQKKGNGRVAGRSLIMWARPRMAEKLLLHLHYECARHKINIPWDAVAHRVHPGSSGAAVLQHVNRLRKELISEGHLVPPIPQKSSSVSQFDPTIRGYVRKYMHGDDKETTRPVRFDEKMDDPKFNLPDAFGPDDGAEQGFANMDAAASDDDIELPDTPTPIRRLPRRGPIEVPQYNKRPVVRGKDREERRDLLDDSADCDGLANQSFTLEHDEAMTPPDMNIYAASQGKHFYDMADEDSAFAHSFDEKPVLPQAGHGEGRHGARRRSAPQDPKEAYFRGFHYYPSFDGMFHPGFYGVGRHGYLPYPMGFPIPPEPPYLAFDRHDPRALPVFKGHQTLTLGRPILDQEEEAMSKPRPEGSTEPPADELMVPNVHDNADINPELRNL